MRIHHSASSLTKFLNCPLQWKHYYIDKWEEPPNNWAIFGVVMHEAVAEKLTHKDYEPDFIDLLKKRGILEEEQLNDLLQLCDSYYSSWLKAQTFEEKPVAVEIDKKRNHPELGRLVGKIDAIYKTENGFKIVDHKFMTNAKKKKDNIQMAMYYLLVPEATEFEYEKIDMNGIIIQRVHKLESGLQAILTAVKGIKEEFYPPTAKEWFIPYCPYLDRCGKCKEWL